MRCSRRSEDLSWRLVTLALALASAGASATDAPAPAEARATLYAFFATWCVPCRAELPHVQALHERYRERGLRVILVSEDAPSSKAAVPAFLKRYGIDAEWVHDADSALLSRFNPSGNIPFTVLLDDEQNVLWAHAGYEPGDERAITAAVEHALGGAPRAAPTAAAHDPTRLTSLERAFDSARGSSQLWTLGLVRTSKFDANDDGVAIGPIARMETTFESRPADRVALSAHLRADALLLADKHGGLEQGGRLERAYVEATAGPFTARAGDGYAAFGHGVALSLRKLDVLGADTTLQGGRVDVEAGFVGATALYGRVNPQNFDPLELVLTEDKDDQLGGAEVRFATPLGEVAPYGLVAHLGGAAPDGRDIRWLVGGTSVTAEILGARLLAEAAIADRRGLALDGAPQHPWAVYASLAFNAGPTSWLVEGKAYRLWQLGRPGRSLAFHEPPSLERIDQQIPGNADTLGPRVRAEWRVADGVSLNVNGVGYVFSQDGSEPWLGAGLVHAFAGGDVRLFDIVSAELAFGARTENDLEDAALRRWLWHVDVDGSWRATPWLGLTAKLNHRTETKKVFSGPREFVWGVVVIGAALPGWATVSLLYGYSTEVASRPVHYPGLEVLFELWRGGRLRVFAGRQVGGRVCVSGTCRDVPPFEGAQAELVLRF